MEFNDLITARRSVRSFTGEEIPGNHVRAILEAGLRAPNACNLQSWHFTCVLGAENVSAFVPGIYRGEWVKNAAFIVVISAKINALVERFGERAKMFPIQDTAAAAENMLLRAADFGYGGCWLGAFDPEACAAHLNLPDELTPVILLPIGVPEAEPPLRDRKAFEEAVTFVGELPGEKVPEEKAPEPYTLRRAYLPNAVFDDLYLGNATVNNIYFGEARFTDINFTGAEFGGLCMNEVKFGCVDMVKAEFTNIALPEAVFRSCSFKNAALEGCEIEGMTINGAPVAELLEKK